MSTDEGIRVEVAVECAGCWGRGGTCGPCRGTGLRTMRATLVPGSVAALKIALAEAVIAEDAAYDAYHDACEDLPRGAHMPLDASTAKVHRDAEIATERAKAALRAALTSKEGGKDG